VHSFHTLLGDLATLTRNVVGFGRDRLTAILATPVPGARGRRASRLPSDDEFETLVSSASSIIWFPPLKMVNPTFRGVTRH